MNHQASGGWHPPRPATLGRIAIAVVFLLGACPAAFADDPAAFPLSEPRLQGISESGLRMIRGAIRSYAERDRVVGASFTVIKNRRTVVSETYGWKDRELAAPLATDALFNIRSMTKMVTGVAAQILIDEGRLGLEDKVSEYLSDFARGSAGRITIEQLLTHRSGLPLTILTSLDDYPDLWSMGNAIGRQGPEFAPGSKFWYSDAGTDALGAVIEVASGMNLDVFVRERILEPLGMDDSYYLHDEATPRDRIASLYYGTNGNWTRIWTPDQPFYPFAWGSQSLYSTPADYAKFLAMLMDGGAVEGKRVVSEAAVGRVLTPVSEMGSLGSDTPAPNGFPGRRTYYGQMAVLYQTDEGLECFGHSGSDGTWAWAWPERDLMVLYFTQSRGQATGIRLETELARLLLDPITVPTPEVLDSYAKYCGKYRADFDSALGTFRDDRFTVQIHEGRLGLDVPGQFIFGLKDPNRIGRWYFDIGDQFSVRFIEDDEGQVVRMQFFEPGKSFSLPRTEGCSSEALSLFSVSSVRDVSTGGLEITSFLMGEPNCPYMVEYSTDLRTWLPFLTNSSPSGAMQVSDLDHTKHPRMFFRARPLLP